MATRGEWMQTCTNRAFYPLDPKPEEIFIEDIAGALSKVCRFGGHCEAFYSVAEHSVHVANILPDSLKLTGLLHDASEAYLGDIVRPAKVELPDYNKMEDAIMEAVAKKFGIVWPLPPQVKVADNRLLADEKEQIMGKAPQPWLPLPLPSGTMLGCWAPQLAKFKFMQLFNELNTVKVAA